MTRILYILCHDDASEEKARNDFSKYSWARIHRIRTQTHLLESGMYQQELMSMYTEWKDAEFVGTLSYKLLERMPWYSHATTFERIVRLIETTTSNEYDVVGFICLAHGGLSAPEHLPNLRQITYDTLNACGMNMRTTFYDMKRRKTIHRNLVELGVSTVMFHNYWMARPSWMLQYIQFFNQTWLPALEKHPLIWTNSMYNGAVSKERLRILTGGRADYYPYHAYVNELLPTFFFTYSGARIRT